MQRNEARQNTKPTSYYLLSVTPNVHTFICIKYNIHRYTVCTETGQVIWSLFPSVSNYKCLSCQRSKVLHGMVLIASSKGGQICSHIYPPTNRHDPRMSNLERSYVYIVSPTVNICESVYLPTAFMTKCEVHPASAILGTLRYSNVAIRRKSILTRD